MLANFWNNYIWEDMFLQSFIYCYLCDNIIKLWV